MIWQSIWNALCWLGWAYVYGCAVAFSLILMYVLYKLHQYGHIWHWRKQAADWLIGTYYQTRTSLIFLRFRAVGWLTERSDDFGGVFIVAVIVFGLWFGFIVCCHA